MQGQSNVVTTGVPLRFKARILVPLSVALIVLVAIVVGGFYWERTREVANEFDVTLESVQSSFDTVLSARLASLLTAAQNLSVNDRLVAAVGNQDRESLRAVIQPVIESLRSTMDRVAISVHGKARQSVFRLPDDDIFSAPDESPLFGLLASTSSPASGLVLARDGEMTLRTALGLRSSGGVNVGFVQFGQDINAVLQDLRKIYGLHFFVAVNKSLIERTAWQDRQKRVGRERVWPEEGDGVFIAATLPSIPTALANSAKASRDLESWPKFVQLVASTGRRKHQVGMLPLHDVTGQEVGSLIVLRDVAAHTENIRDTVQYIALIGGATAILLFAFFYEVLSRSERRIEFQRRAYNDLPPRTPPPPLQALPPISESASLNQDARDTVTGLSSLSAISERANVAIQTALPDGKLVGFVLLEITNLNEVVDAFGDAIADAMLSQVTWRLKEGLRSSDLIAKAGFNEFGIVLPSVNLESAITHIQKIVGLLDPTYIIGSVALDCRVVMGLALCPYHGNDVSMLFRRADTAKRAAVKTGESYAVFDSRPETTKQRQVSLLADLHHAVQNDLLSLVCFPRVEIKTERINGVETLLRWKHTEKGYIPPQEIFDLAAKSGLVKVLTRWVVSKTLKQQAAWVRSSMGFNVAINVSRMNVADPLFADELRDLLHAAEIDPTTITLELTERALTSDPQGMTAGLRRLHAVGVQLCIDDVGTGNSAIPYLKTLPVSEIKIDESVIYTLIENTNNLAFVRTAIDLAHSLGITVCAEGVKNKDIWDLLSELGCDCGQGYYITQPSSYGAFECWLVNSKYGMGRKEVACDWKEGI